VSSRLDDAHSAAAFEGIGSLDDLSLMQIAQCKNDIYSGQESQRIETFSNPAGIPNELQNNQQETESGGHRNEDSGTELSLSSNSEIQPPSPDENRQEVILYHLQDAPIRTFLEWTDYDRMIQEIGFHFSVNPASVIDAYEVNTPLRGISDDAVPIIVHLFPDIAVGQVAKLVLIDLELHGHRVESHFRAGPVTRRFVMAVPEWSDRNSVLMLANVDLYCHLEGDRCLVWLDNFRWPDYDLTPRRIAHGDYIRIAIPPTERFDCPTVQMIQWTQAGLSDQAILDHATDHEALSGYSPSLLSEDAVQALAVPIAESDDSDVMHAMQTHVDHVSYTV